MRDKGGFLGNFVLKKSHLKEIFKHCACYRKHAMYLTKCQFMCIHNWKTTKYWWFFFCFVPSIKDSGRLEKNVRKLEYMSEVFDTPTTKYWTQVFRGQFSDRSSRPQNVKANFRLFFDSCHVFPLKYSNEKLTWTWRTQCLKIT